MALWVVALALTVGSGWVWQVLRHRPPPSPPVVDLKSIDPKAARALQQRLDAVVRDPRSGEAWGWLGALLRVYDFRPQALACLLEAQALDSKNPRWPYHQGMALTISSPLEAIAQFRRAAELCGDDPATPRIRLARLLAELGRWEETQAALAPLLERHPEFSPARLLQGRVAHTRGELSQAIALARPCTQDPRCAHAAWSLLAQIHRQQGDVEAATDAARRAAASPADQAIGDPFEDEVTRLRGDPRSLSEPAHALLAAGRLNDAARLIDRLVLDHADYPDTWLLRGRLELLRKDPAAAERSLRRHLELSSQSVQGLFQLGSALLAQNRFDQAGEAFAQATRLKADFGPAYYNLGFALARSGRPREAVAAFRESLRHNPERADTYFLLSDLCLRLGEKEEALKWLRQAEALDPADPRLAALRARAQSMPR